MAVPSPAVRFNPRGLENLIAPEPLLWEEADLSPIAPERQAWYWHGTLTSNIPSILDHGLLPEKTSDRVPRVCLAARAHVAFLFARMQLFYAANPDEDISLIAVPGRMLATKDLRIDHGCIYGRPYGRSLPHIRKAKLRNWRTGEWNEFQAIFGCITTRQSLAVDPAWVRRIPMPGLRDIKYTILSELEFGRPQRPDPNTCDSDYDFP